MRDILPINKDNVVNNEQRTKLKLSIAHWEDMIDKEEGAPSSNDCPCCNAFMTATLDNGICERCPIMQYTKRDGCKGTPYEAAAEEFFEGEEMYTDNFKELAQIEVDFLKEVLEAGNEN